MKGEKHNAAKQKKFILPQKFLSQKFILSQELILPQEFFPEEQLEFQEQLKFRKLIQIIRFKLQHRPLRRHSRRPFCCLPRPVTAQHDLPQQLTFVRYKGRSRAHRLYPQKHRGQRGTAAVFVRLQ